MSRLDNLKGKYTEEDRLSVLKLFYRKELRPGEKVIDNRDSVIAKELNLGLSFVTHTISSSLECKYENWPLNEN